MKLWEIGHELQALSDLLDETNGEIPPEAEAIIDEWFKSVGEDQAIKLDGYVHLIKRLEGEAMQAGDVIKQFEAKAKSRRKSSERLKQRIKDYMEATRQAKLPTASGWEICIQKNGGKLPLCVVNEEVTEEYKIQPPPEVDNGKIRDALEQGKELSFARFGDRGTQLRIR